MSTSGSWGEEDVVTSCPRCGSLVTYVEHHSERLRNGYMVLLDVYRCSVCRHLVMVVKVLRDGEAVAECVFVSVRGV